MACENAGDNYYLCSLGCEDAARFPVTDWASKGL